jgi:hypothetical protein
MKRDLIILDCHEIKCPLVLLFVFKEFAGYFKRNNYNVKIVNNITELHNNSIVFMGNTFNCDNPVNILKTIAPSAIYIGWYWHDINTNDLQYFIYTYENMLNIYYDLKRVNDLIKIRSFKNNVPFLLRADEDPLLVGTYKKNIIYVFCYMGWRYCENLVPKKFKGLYHGVDDHNKFFDYEKRKNIYLSSLFALGFQSNDNIVSKHVSQRIFEGLAYGCIVLSNSLPACEQTNNIVIHVSTLSQVEQIMTYYINNPELAEKKRKEGYEFSKQFGTNQLSAQNFINIIQEKFEIAI